MLALALLWVSLWCVCFGLGAAVYAAAFRLDGPSFRAIASLDQLLWVGICVVLAMLQLASLGVALTGWVMLALGALSALGWPTLYRLFRRCRRADIVRTLFALIVLLSLANSALQKADWYDTVSTHVQQAKWAHEFPAVLGLANLNGKLGFDLAHHLLAAVLSFGPFAHRSSHLAVSFLLCSVALVWVLTLLSSGGSGPRTERTFVALTLAYVAGKAWTNELASLSGDLAMASLLLPAVRELIRLGPSLRRGRRTGWSLLVLGALSGALFAVKFSALPVLLAFTVVALRRHSTWRALLAASLLPALLVVATVARRIVLTGWPLYPIPVLGLHVSWAVPHEQTLSQYRWIQAWARLPKHDPNDVLDHGFAHWFLPWFERFRHSREWALGLVAVAALLVRNGAPRLAIVTALACVVYWFLGAPDVRFGGVFFWVLFAVSLTPLLERDRALTFIVCAGLVWWNDGHVVRIVDGAAIPVDEHPPTRTDTMVRDGATFDINVPTQGDLCGDAPLPCSNTLGEGRMREPGALARGFMPR